MKSSRRSSTRRRSRSAVARVLLSVALLVLPAAGRSARAADEEPEKPAYIAMVMADQARDAQRWDEARQRYGEALRLFRQVPGNLPEYKREAIQYRIAYCQNEIEKLRERQRPTPPPVPAPTPAPAPGTDNTALRRENEDLRAQVADLKKQLAMAADETARAKALSQVSPAGAAPGEADQWAEEKQRLTRLAEEEKGAMVIVQRALERQVDSLTKSLKDMQKERDTVQAQVASLKAQLAQQSGVSGEAAQARAALENRAAAAESEAGRLRSAAEASAAQASQLRAQLAALKRQQEQAAAAQREAVDAAAKENAGLQSQVAALRKQLAAAAGAKEGDASRALAAATRARDDAQSRAEALGAQVQDLQKQLLAARTSLNEQAAALEKARRTEGRVADLEGRISALTEEVAARRAAASAAEQARAAAETKLAPVSKSLEGVKRELAERSAQLQEMEAARKADREERAAAVRAAGERDLAQKAAEQYKARYALVREQLAQVESTLNEREAGRVELDRKVAELTRAAQRQADQLEALKAERDAAREQVAQLQGQLGEAQSMQADLKRQLQKALDDCEVYRRATGAVPIRTPDTPPGG